MEQQLTTKLDADLAKIEAYKAEIDKMGDNLLKINIIDSMSLSIAQQNLSKANEMLKFIDTQSAVIKKPYWDAGKAVDKVKKSLTDALAAGMTHIKSQIADWENKRLEELKNIPEANKEEISVFATDKTRNVRWNWTFYVEDLAAVPKEWLMVDESKVKEYLAANKEELVDGDIVNGIKFYKKMTITV